MISRRNLAKLVLNRTNVKKHVLFDFECTDESVILLHIRAHRGYVFGRTNLMSVDANRSTYSQRAAICFAKIEHVQQCGLSCYLTPQIKLKRQYNSFVCLFGQLYSPLPLGPKIARISFDLASPFT